MDIICPRCKTSKYRNPAVRFMVNVCGHSLCTSCVELQFSRGSGKCEVCKLNLKKGNFRPQMFLSAEVERGVFIRKRILKDFSKTLKDFKSDNEYNDYLEEVETIIYNLSNGIDVEEMNAKVERYKAENEEVLKMAKANNGEILAMEESSKVDEEDVPRMQDNSTNDSQDDSTAIKNEKQESEVTHALVGGAYQYKELRVFNEGPAPPQSDLLKELGYLSSLPRESLELELAGGFSLEVSCYKSLCSAMTGLFVLDGLKG